MTINGIKVHQDITVELVAEAVERAQSTTDNPGFCICCGAELGDVDPDARGDECEVCDEEGVYGAEELLMEIA